MNHLVKYIKQIVSAVLIVMAVFVIYGVRIPEARAAIAFDAATDSGTFSAVSSKSFTHTATGADVALVVGCVMDDVNNIDNDITNVTWDGVAISNPNLRAGGTTDENLATEIWYGTNIPTGAKTIAVTFAGTLTEGRCFASTFTGVDTTDAKDAQNTAIGDPSSADPSVTVTTVAANAWIVDTMIHANNTDTTTADYTVIFNGSMGTEQFGTQRRAATTAGNYTMSWTETNDELADWAIAAISLKPAAAAGAAAPNLNSDTHVMIQDMEVKIEDTTVIIID